MIRSLLLGAFGLVVASANIAFWMFVALRGQERFQRVVERKFNVVIGLGYKGHWRVSGDGSWLRRVAIEWLQLVYFLAAFVVWAAAMLIVVGLLAIVQP